MRRPLTLLLIFWAGIAKSATPSPEAFTTSSLSKDSVIYPRFSPADSIPITNKHGFNFVPRSTKLYDVILLAIPEEELPAASTTVPKAGIPAGRRKSLLKINGNILYDVNYRSRIDTPYAENNVYPDVLSAVSPIQV
jgi:hypothetical protein